MVSFSICSIVAEIFIIAFSNSPLMKEDAISQNYGILRGFWVIRGLLVPHLTNFHGDLKTPGGGRE